MPMNPNTRSTLESVNEIWKRRHWIFILAFITMFSAVATLVWNLPKLYRSTATVLVGQDNISDTFIKSSVSSDIGTRLQVIKQEILSRPRLEEIISTFNLYPELRKEASIAIVSERMRKDIRFDLINTQQQWGPGNTVAFSLSYQGFDPELVAQITNMLASSYLAENNRIRGNQASSTTKFLEQGVNDAKAAMNSQRSTEVKSQVVVRPPSNAGQAERTALVTQITLLRQELAGLRSRYTEKYPDVIKVKNELARREADLKNLPAVVATTDTSPTVTPTLNPLEAATEDRYLSLLGRYEDAQLAEILEQEGEEQFRLLESAVASNIPVEPHTMRLLIMGLILSLLFAAAIVFVAEQFDNSFHSKRDLNEFTRVPILVSIPRIQTPGDSVRHVLSFSVISVASIIAVVLIIQASYMIANGNESLVWLLAQSSA